MQTSTQQKTKQPAGMLGFSIVWLGQIISVLASNMTGFGLSLWMYKQTQSATAMAGLQVAFAYHMHNLIADLALRGTFVLVDKPLFFRRATAQTDTQLMSSEEFDRHFIPDQRRPGGQTWKKLFSLARIAATTSTSLSERARALAWVARMSWWSKADLISEIQTSMRGLPMR